MRRSTFEQKFSIADGNVIWFVAPSVHDVPNHCLLLHVGRYESSGFKGDRSDIGLEAFTLYDIVAVERKTTNKPAHSRGNSHPFHHYCHRVIAAGTIMSDNDVVERVSRLYRSRDEVP